MKFKNASRKEMIWLGGREAGGLHHLGFERLSPGRFFTLGTRHMIGFKMVHSSKWVEDNCGRRDGRTVGGARTHGHPGAMQSQEGGHV